MGNLREIQTTNSLLNKDNDKTNRDLFKHIVSRDSFAVKTLTLTANTTLDYRYSHFFINSGTTFTLPLSTTWGPVSAPRITVINNTSGNITIQTTSPDTIFNLGISSITLAVGDVYEFVAANGTYWLALCVQAGINAFIPILSGASTAGIGTYTIQQGSFIKQGQNLSLSLNLIWTAHTGIGQMQITLPSPWIAFTVPTNHTINVDAEWAWGAGVSKIEGLIAGNKISLYKNSSGVLAVQNIVGSGTLRITGTVFTTT